MANLSKRAARAFAVLALAVASDLHERGAEVDAKAQQRLVDLANKAVYEDIVERGCAVPCVRSLDGKWCAMIVVAGQHVTVHDLAEIGAREVKKRPVTCAMCRRTLGIA